MIIAAVLAHYLFPKPSNNHKAKLLQPASLLAISALMVLLQFVVRYTGGVSYTATSTLQPSILGYASQIPPEEVIRLTNEKRTAAGLTPVVFNQSLSEAAKEKGQHMLANGYWAHVAPDGTDPWFFFTKHNYKYRYAGENLARDFASPTAAVEAWMASPSHRDNLLSPKYKDIGIGVVEGSLAGSEATIIVQLFGTSLSDSGQTASVAQASTINITAVPTKPVATSTPTSTPEPSPTEVPVMIAQTEPSRPLPLSPPVELEASAFQTLLSPFQTTKGISIVVLSILIVVTILDAVIIAMKRVPRVSGRAFAHLAFFGMIIAIVLIIRAGKIL